MNNLIVKHRGWLIAFSLAVALSVIISPPQVHEISNSRLRKLIEDREVAEIAIIKSRVGNRGKYIAEITLTPPALKKYEQLKAGVSSSIEGPHFTFSIGDSEVEVNQWKEKMMNQNGSLFKKKF